MAKVRTVGSSMWSDALEDEVVAVNPWRGQRIKPHAAKAYKILTPAEFAILLDVFNPHYRLLIQTLGESGLRWGEAQRLTPDDIEGQRIHIRKSKNGRARQVQVSAELAAELRRSLPFTNGKGRPIDYRNFRSKHWVPATEGTGWRLHDLRHSHASWLLDAGADLVSVRDRLGHSNINVTSRYLHTLPTAQDRALDALDRALGRAS